MAAQVTQVGVLEIGTPVVYNNLDFPGYHRNGTAAVISGHGEFLPNGEVLYYITFGDGTETGASNKDLE